MEFARTSIKLSHVAIAKADQLAYEIERYKSSMSCRAPEKQAFAHVCHFAAVILVACNLLILEEDFLI
jgi:hypothetical protein